MAGTSVAADAHHRVAADLQVEVRRAVVDGDFQQIVDVHRCQAVRRLATIIGPCSPAASRDSREIAPLPGRRR